MHYIPLSPDLIWDNVHQIVNKYFVQIVNTNILCVYFVEILCIYERGGGGGGGNDYFWGLGELRQRFYPESPWFLVPISPQKSPLVPI